MLYRNHLGEDVRQAEDRGGVMENEKIKTYKDLAVQMCRQVLTEENMQKMR